MKSNPLEWKYTQKKLFPISTPSRAVWNDVEDIVLVLNTVGQETNFTHLCLPNGGDLEIEYAALSQREVGCIELIADGLVNILKPKSLHFESFKSGEKWAYFRLECDTLDPSGVNPEINYDYEERVLDLGEGNYIASHYWDDNEYEGKPLPESTKPVSRFFKGAFVIFQKTSPYNSIFSIYDGIYSEMTSDEFRACIEKMITAIDTRYSKEGIYVQQTQ